MQAKLWEADADWRGPEAGAVQALAPTAYDQYKANYLEAKANAAVAEAGVEVAVAAVSQSDTLKKDEANLAYCTVKSPVAGVVVDRRVNMARRSYRA